MVHLSAEQYSNHDVNTSPSQSNSGQDVMDRDPPPFQSIQSLQTVPSQFIHQDRQNLIETRENSIHESHVISTPNNGPSTSSILNNDKEKLHIS